MASEQLQEDDIEDELEIYGSSVSNSGDSDEGELRDFVPRVNLENPEPIIRPLKQAMDMSRPRLFSEMKAHMKIADPSARGRAEMAHSTFHLPRTTLVDMFGVSKAVADDVIAKCHCSDVLAPNRHPQHKPRGHVRPLGPNVECSCDVMHLSRGKYILAARDNYSGYIRLAPLRRLTSDSIFTAFLKMFLGSGLPVTIKTDGAKYFSGAHIKALLVDKGVLLKSIAPAHSDANLVERDFRSCRNFLSRFGASVDSWNTIYMLNLWLNIFCNNQVINGQKVTPYELHFGFKPDLDRLLKLSIPSENYIPIRSEVKNAAWVERHNSKVVKTDSKLKIPAGTSVLYKKYGSKDPTLLKATVVSSTDDTYNLKLSSGLIITRLGKDVIV